MCFPIPQLKLNGRISSDPTQGRLAGHEESQNLHSRYERQSSVTSYLCPLSITWRLCNLQPLRLRPRWCSICLTDFYHRREPTVRETTVVAAARFPNLHIGDAITELTKIRYHEFPVNLSITGVGAAFRPWLSRKKSLHEVRFRGQPNRDAELLVRTTKSMGDVEFGAPAPRVLGVGEAGEREPRI